MKRKIKIISYIFVSFLVSCSEKEVQIMTPTSEETKKEFMRIESESYSVVMTETISLDKHAAFCTGSTLQNIPENVLLQSGTGAVPIESDEIPIWEYTSTVQSVYNDGTIEFDITSNIIDDEEINAILSVGASSIAFEAIPKRAVYSNGTMTLYDKDGNILYSAVQPQPDMTEFCDSVAHYYERYQNELLVTNPSGTKGSGIDIDSVISFVCNSFADGAVSQYNVEKLSDSRISIEYTCDNSCINTVVSSDLMRTYSIQKFTDNQLVSQTVFEYAPDREINDYCVAIGSIMMKSPKKVITQQLVYASDGIPKVRTKIVGYKKNKTTISIN